MKHAFTKAGYRSPQDEILMLARKAAESKSWDAAYNEFATAISGRADLLWAFFMPYRDQAIRSLFASLARDDTHRNVGGRPGHRLRVPHMTDAGQNPPAVGHAGLAAVSKVYKYVLDTLITENGKPLAQCTKEDLKNLSIRNRRYAAFYEHLAQPMKASETVADKWTAQAVEKIYRANEN